MHRCKSCSAPLKGVFCDYCGTRNNVDLAHFKPLNIRPGQVRPCPVCHTAMSTIDVGKKVPFLIERCESCYGLFFDKHELDTMIEMSVKGSRNVDLKLLQELTENPRYVDVVAYRKCPVCSKFMNRRNFGGRSGVIMDECAEHGLWLDPGELKQIFEWVKAGGLTKQQESAAQSAMMPKNPARKKERRTPSAPASSSPVSGGGFDLISELFYLLR